MKRVLVLQHESYEALGTWAPLLREMKSRIRFVNFERQPDACPSIERYDGVILLGGYMGVYEVYSYHHLKFEFSLIEAALKLELPVLGICLGSQILATVLGATVKPHTEREMGWYPVELTEAGATDPMIGHFGRSETLFQSHGDIFEIPKSAVHLARSAICSGQAFRYGKNAYGLQFHLEVNRPIIDDWLQMPENLKIFEQSQGKFDPQAIRQDTDRHLKRSMELSQESFRKFLEIGGARSRPMRLGSGRT